MFLLIVFSLIIGIRVYSWNASTLAGNAMPMPFGWGISVVLSGSMEPVLSVNDLVLVREADGYEIGDIVVYQDGSSLVIHKIISIDGDTVVTMGEANNTADGPISISAVKGKAVFSIPSVGAAVRFLKTPAATVILLIAIALLFELPFLREKKKSEKELEQIKDEIRRLKGG